MTIDSSTDDRFTARALEVARQGVGLASPNPHVGAVLVKNGEIIGEGTQTYASRKHAEVLALERAGAAARGATLYLNLEPCCHMGRTGPCVDAILAAGVARVVACMADPNPLVAGKGFERLRAGGISVTTGIREPEARHLNQAFAKWIQTRCPLVTIKAALTLDGKIAPFRGEAAKTGAPAVGGAEREWISGAIARAHVQELRHQSDAILVGIGTALADDPLLTDRSGRPRRRPLLRVVADSRLRLPVDSQLVQSAQEDLVVFCVSGDALRKKELERRGVRVEIVEPVAATGRPDLQQILCLLGEREITSLLIEGGSLIHGAALAGDLADKVFLYYAPRILGGNGVPLAAGVGFHRLGDAPHVRDITLHRFGEDFAVEGYLKDPY